VIQAVIVSSAVMVRLSTTKQAVGISVFLVATGWTYWMHYALVGSVNLTGAQDWRQAVAVGRSVAARTQGPVVVLFRSGFVEEDLVTLGQAPEATRSPLRSPGQLPQAWHVKSLSRTWEHPSRDGYFRAAIGPEVEQAQTVIVLSAQGPRSLCGTYADCVRGWIEHSSNAEWSVRAYPHIRGVDMFVLERMK
jgi:hypothetical protein